MNAPLRPLRTILRSLILRPLRREKTRTALTVFGIAVGVSVLVAIQLSNESALRAFSESVSAVAGRANYQLVPDSGFLDQGVLLRLQPLWQSGARFAPVIDVEGFIAPTEQPVRLLGVDLLSDLHFRDYKFARISAGSSAPADVNRSLADFLELFRADSIILPKTFAQESGLGIGRKVVINVLGRERTFTIRGLLEPEGPATAFNGNIAIADIATAQAAFDLQGRLSRVDLLLPDGIEGRARSLLGDARSGLRLERPSRRNERVGKMLRAFRINLFALAAVSLLVGIFLVYNTVLISILRRRGDVGILKTLGAGAGQIFAAFILEGALFGLVGAVLGIAIGYGLAWGTLDLIGRTINSLYFSTAPSEIRLTADLIFGAIGLGVAVSIASAFQPALEAAAIRPHSLMASGLYQRIPWSRSLAYAAAGGGLFLLGAIACRIPPVAAIPIGGYASVVFVLGGFAMITPAAIVLFSHSVKGAMGRAFGLVGRLAAVGLPASLRRVAVAGAALSVAIGMMVAVAMMVGSFRETVSSWVNQTVTSDLWIRPSRGLSNSPAAAFPNGITRELARIPFIESFDRFRGHDVIFRDALISVGSGDFRVAAAHGEMPMVAPRSQKKAIENALLRRGVLISESLSIKYDLRVGDPIELPTRFGRRSFPITGIYRDYSSDRGVVVMDRSLYIQAYDDDTINTIAIYLRKGVDPETARSELERLLGKRYRAFAFTNATIRREVMRIFDQTFLITYALLAVSLIVAVLGIINTLAALILERRREIALLKVLGLSRGEILRMIVLESAILGAVSSILGLASGFALSWILIFVINKQSFGWTIEFDPPAGLIAASLIVTFLATVGAGLYPARLANRILMSSALKSE